MQQEITQMYDAAAGRRLQTALKLSGISQKDAAKRLGISENGLVNYIKARRTPPSDVLSRIAQMCNTEVEWIVSGRINTTNCGAIGALLGINFDRVESLTSISNTSKTFLDAVAACEISPSADIIRRFQDAGLLKGEQVNQKNKEPSDTPTFAKKEYTWTKDKDVCELEKERDWLRRQNDRLLEQNQGLLEQNVKLLDQNGELIKVMKSLKRSDV